MHILSRVPSSDGWISAYLGPIAILAHLVSNRTFFGPLGTVSCCYQYGEVSQFVSQFGVF